MIIVKKFLNRHLVGLGSKKRNNANFNTVKHTAKNGFTLVELVVVITIIGMMMTIAVPSLASYRAMAKEKVIQTGVMQFSRAFQTVIYTSESQLTPIMVPANKIPLNMPSSVQAGKFYDVFEVSKLALTFVSSKNLAVVTDKSTLSLHPQNMIAISMAVGSIVPTLSAFEPTGSVGVYVTNADFIDAQGSVFVNYYHSDYGLAPNYDWNAYDLYQDGQLIG